VEPRPLGGNLFSFGDILLSVVLGLSFPHVRDIARIGSQAGYGIAAAHLWLFLIAVAALIWYWLNVKSWYADLAPSYGAADHLLVAIVALLFYLLAIYATQRDPLPYFTVLCLLAATSFAGDLWFTFGVMRRRAAADPRVAALFRIQSSPGYLTRSIALPLLFALLLAVAAGSRERMSEAGLKLALAASTTAILAGNELMVHRWRRREFARLAAPA
jgi:hypothetical protein